MLDSKLKGKSENSFFSPRFAAYSGSAIITTSPAEVVGFFSF
jgi:hypothetical protein